MLKSLLFEGCHRRCSSLGMAEACKLISVVCCERKMYFSLHFRVCFLSVETILAIITSPQEWERSNVMIVSMCQSCPDAYLQNHVTNLHQFFVHVASDRGTVLYCSTLCTFRFVDDGMSSSSSRKGTIAKQYRITLFSDNGPCNAF